MEQMGTIPSPSVVFDRATFPHPLPSWIPAFAGMTFGGAGGCLPRPALGDSRITPTVRLVVVGRPVGVSRPAPFWPTIRTFDQELGEIGGQNHDIGLARSLRRRPESKPFGTRAGLPPRTGRAINRRLGEMGCRNHNTYLPRSLRSVSGGLESRPLGICVSLPRRTGPALHRNHRWPWVRHKMGREKLDGAGRVKSASDTVPKLGTGHSATTPPRPSGFRPAPE